MATIGVMLLAAVLGVALSCLIAALRKGRTGYAVATLLLLLLASSTTALAARLHLDAQPIPLRGGVKIQETSGQFQVYLGEQLMLASPTILSWDDLLSQRNLPPGAAGSTAGVLANPSAEDFGGPGATFVSGSPGARNYGIMGGSRQSGVRIACGNRQMLLKRADGSFDLIVLLDFEIVNSQGETRRFYLVVRPRSNQSGAYANSRVQMSSSSSGRAETVNIQLIIEPGGPSVAIPEEVKQKGLWMPGK